VLVNGEAITDILTGIGGVEISRPPIRWTFTGQGMNRAMTRAGGRLRSGTVRQRPRLSVVSLKNAFTRSRTCNQEAKHASPQTATLLSTMIRRLKFWSCPTHQNDRRHRRHRGRLDSRIGCTARADGDGPGKLFCPHTRSAPAVERRPKFIIASHLKPAARRSTGRTSSRNASRVTAKITFAEVRGGR
jgi:hypothetical protein